MFGEFATKVPYVDFNRALVCVADIGIAPVILAADNPHQRGLGSHRSVTSKHLVQQIKFTPGQEQLFIGETHRPGFTIESQVTVS